MNITSNIVNNNLTSLNIEEINENELINSTITTKITITSTINVFIRLFNSTRLYPFLRPTLSTTQSTFLLNKYFIFQSSFNRRLRCAEIGILSLALALYAIVFILFMQLTVLRISRNTAISGGGSRSRSQRRQQHMRSLIWTSNYLLIDFLNLLYELAYVTIHLSGLLPLKSIAGRFYCQLQVYLPLYLTVLMAYSLTAISIYRRRHFANFNNPIGQSIKRVIIKISALWIMPVITSVIPALLLVQLNILKITQYETTNQCQISYTYESNVEAIYIFYRLGNIFLLPISISLACYIAIYVNLIRMQRRFSQAFERHLRVRKNLISQILLLFLNFTVFWLPADMIMLYTKNLYVKDTAQVIKSLNILLDPIIIICCDTRFSSAAGQLMSRWPFNSIMRFINSNRQYDSSVTTQVIIRKPRLQRSRQTTKQQMTGTSTWNIANNDDITVLESVSNYSLQNQKTKRQQKRLRTSLNQRQSTINRRRKTTKKRMKIAGNHV